MTEVLSLPGLAAGNRARPAAKGSLFVRWLARQQERDELRRLLHTAPHLLTDIGVTPAQAAEEVAKPFWRA